MNIAAFLAPLSKIHGEKPALSMGMQIGATYGALAQRVASLAGGLRRKLKLAARDRVAIAMSNCPEYVEIQLACWHAGLCIVPVNSKLHEKEFAFIVQNCEAVACFVDEDLADVFQRVKGNCPGLKYLVDITGQDYAGLVEHEPIPLVDVSYDDPAWIFYTSGTTGRPKGATLSNRNLWGMSLRYFADIDLLSPQDCYLHAAPLSHGSGLYGLPHLMRGSHIIVPESRGFDADEIFDLMENRRNISFFAAPTMLTRLTNHRRASSCRIESLRTICYGGAPMYLSDLKRALSAFGPRLYQLFAQGEAPMTGTGLNQASHADIDHPRYEARLASGGVARTGVEVRVVDQDEHDVPAGESGEILFRSDVTMLGYWNNPDATATTLRGGWLHTGDIGVIDEDGFVTVKDRSKDLIISGGTNIYPREIEEVLLTDARVLEASVIGRPDPDWGENVVAFVVTREGQTITEGELDALCLSNIARFKRPKRYVFIEQLPKNSYGKVLKTDLRKILE